ncbi:anti-anti-sigma factor [Actinoplanes octamycinicus]|uniref:Anti-sigma factor antagonist n=1 Tax=Actinoplanes octamycinicus TaxID=135948 RepID=A0A7W7H4H6_9ACTN|nr:STAS domain-containing protein [Actinoplanes octamycinicus]MBB4743870.1 anti-anti-sigma factor [Actinoplanes octamycinicus]GIE58499.1 hypothetical protein Aoc01nite_39010 [Actinoplanes octamycinicus]
MRKDASHHWRADSRGTLAGAVTRTDSQQLVVTLDGEIDMANARNLARWLTTLLGGTTAATLVIDAERVTFCDAAGVRELLAVEQAAARSGLSCTLRNPHRSVKQVLRMLGVESLLT